MLTVAEPSALNLSNYLLAISEDLFGFLRRFFKCRQTFGFQVNFSIRHILKNYESLGERPRL